MRMRLVEAWRKASRDIGLVERGRRANRITRVRNQGLTVNAPLSARKRIPIRVLMIAILRIARSRIVVVKPIMIVVQVRVKLSVVEIRSLFRKMTAAWAVLALTHGGSILLRWSLLDVGGVSHLPHDSILRIANCVSGQVAPANMRPPARSGGYSVQPDISHRQSIRGNASAAVNLARAKIAHDQPVFSSCHKLAFRGREGRGNEGIEEGE